MASVNFTSLVLWSWSRPVDAVFRSGSFLNAHWRMQSWRIIRTFKKEVILLLVWLVPTTMTGICRVSLNLKDIDPLVTKKLLHLLKSSELRRSFFDFGYTRIRLSYWGSEIYQPRNWNSPEVNSNCSWVGQNNICSHWSSRSFLCLALRTFHDGQQNRPNMDGFGRESL